MKGHKGPRRPNRIRNAVAYMDNLDGTVCDRAPISLFQAMGIAVSDQVSTCVTRFLACELNTCNSLTSPSQLTEHVEACKVRYEELFTTVTTLSELFSSDDATISLQRVGGKPLITPGRDTEVRIEEYCEEYILPLTTTVKPRSYRHLYKAIGYYIQDNLELINHRALDLAPFFEAILSFAKVYDDYRGGSEWIQQFEQQAYDRLATPEEHHLSQWFNELLTSVIGDIIDGDMPYVQDISNALRRSLKWRESSFDPYEDYHVSESSTGTSIKLPNENHQAVKERLPGLLASIVEYDPLLDLPEIQEFDKIVGYNSNYLTKDQIDQICQKYNLEVFQDNRKTLTIPQHKLKRRIIFTACNAVQDRATYFQNRQARFNDMLQQDCTTNQQKGIDFIKVYTNPSLCNSLHNSVYCMDLSNATDTLSREFQQRCVEVTFPHLGKYWPYIVFAEHKFVFSSPHISPRYYTARIGQPQGYKSSFPMFAWAHHILMRCVMKYCHLERENPRNWYRVLGDDSTINCIERVDILSSGQESYQILEAYKLLCSEVNWTVNDKGYIYHDGEEHAVAEFAKTRVADGKVFSPIPTVLMLKCYQPRVTLATILLLNKKELGYHTAPEFFQLKGKYHSVDWLLERLRESNYSLTTEKEFLIKCLVHFELGDFKYFYEDEELHLTDEESFVFIMSYFRTAFESTILDQWITQKSIGAFDTTKRSIDPFIGSKMEEELLPLFDLPTGHKYWFQLEKNEELIQCVESLFSNMPKFKAKGVATLGFSQEEYNLILELCEDLLEGFDQMINIGFQPFIAKAEKAIKILTRFNPRSESRASGRDSDLLDFLEKNYSATLFDRAVYNMPV